VRLSPYRAQRKRPFCPSGGVDGNDYSLVETDSCAALRWDLLSVWANAGKEENEFYNLVQTFSTQAFALDMLRIGFNGKPCQNHRP
jgi:hypothetical protein